MKKVTIITHDGVFHADEVFATALIKVCVEAENINNGVSVVRTRDLDIINNHCKNTPPEDFYMVDVGGEYNAEENKFDHHQKSFNKTHKVVIKGSDGKVNAHSVPMASFGLVWEKMGMRLVEGLLYKKEYAEEAYGNFVKELVIPVDAHDNRYRGYYACKETMFFQGPSVSSIISSKNSDDIYDDDKQLDRFYSAVATAASIITDTLNDITKRINDRSELLEVIESQEDMIKNKGYVVLHRFYRDAGGIITRFNKNVNFFIFPGEQGKWNIQGVPTYPGSSDTKVPFPEAWRGLTGESLNDKTPEGCNPVFCHKGGFFAVSQTFEGACLMADAATEASR